MSKYVHWGWIEIILRAFSEIFGEQMNPADPKIMCNFETYIENDFDWVWNIGNTEMPFEASKEILTLVKSGYWRRDDIDDLTFATVCGCWFLNFNVRDIF